MRCGKLEKRKINLTLGVDFRSALGVGQFPPMKGFNFKVFVKSNASDEDIQKINSNSTHNQIIEVSNIRKKSQI